MRTLFWRLLNQRIVVQQGNKFLNLPISEEQLLANDAELAKNIADNFQSAPLKETGFELAGAVQIAVNL